MIEKIALVHVPLSWDRVHRSFFKSWVEMTSPEIVDEMFERHGVRLRYLIDEGFPIDFNRNRAVETMMTIGASWLISIDADMVFPKRTIPMLFEAQNEEFSVVTGNYHKKSAPHQSVAGWYVPNETVSRETLSTLTKWGFIGPDGAQTLLHKPCSDFGRERPFAVDISGGGCLLVAASVLHRLKQPYFKYFDPFRNGGTLGNITEDMYFFSELKKAGIKVRLDPRIQCGHLSEKEVTWMDQDLGAQCLAVPS